METINSSAILSFLKNKVPQKKKKKINCPNLNSKKPLENEWGEKG